MDHLTDSMEYLPPMEIPIPQQNKPCHGSHQNRGSGGTDQLWYIYMVRTIGFMMHQIYQYPQDTILKQLQLIWITQTTNEYSNMGPQKRRRWIHWGRNLPQGDGKVFHPGV